MKNIIVIIENRSILADLFLFLDPSVYKLYLANSYKKAETYLKSKNISLILLEGGYENLKMAEELNNLKKDIFFEISTIVIDHGKDSSLDDFLKKGINDFIPHPFSEIQINQKIYNHIFPNINNKSIRSLVDNKVQELSEVQSVMIESLSTLAEYRDPETGGHIKRTQNYVKALALELRKEKKFTDFLNDETIELMYLSVPLHDIGKVGIRDDILLKPGKLSEEEFEIMKKHTTFGHDTIFLARSKLDNNAFLKFADDVAYTHHEKWDGSGYPRGLKEQEIPLIGRLMAIADVYDAIISKRVYKKAMNHNDAKKIIIEGRGSHFDPDIVDAFINIEESFKNIATIYADKDYAELEKANKKPPSTRVKNVLLVDDNLLMLRIFSNQIKNMGFEVTSVNSAKKALYILENSNIDLLVTDLEMPIMNGFELTKQVRENNKGILIFALTSANFNLSKDDIESFGFNDFMLKPLDTKIFQLKLSKYN